MPIQNVSADIHIAMKDGDSLLFKVKERTWISDLPNHYGVLDLGNVKIVANPQKWHDIAMHILAKLQEHQENQMKEGELID